MMTTVQATTCCAWCGQPFTDAEWDARHADENGDDVHDRCCRQCIDQLAATGDDEAQPVIDMPGIPPSAKAAPKRRRARRKLDFHPADLAILGGDPSL